jgi:broad specificity phosphatase PhoE
MTDSQASPAPDLPATHLVFVRHGRASEIDGRCIGQTDVPLSPEGAASIRAFASTNGPQLTGAVEVVCSDLVRATDSAQLLAAALGTTVARDARLREMNFGAWDGRTWSDIEQLDRERFNAWLNGWIELAPPGGESLSMVRSRAVSWLSDTLDHGDPIARAIVVVSHAGWIRVAVSHLLERPMSQLFELPVDYAHATVLRSHAGGHSLVALNTSRLT